jgi:hypothetical protein
MLCHGRPAWPKELFVPLSPAAGGSKCFAEFVAVSVSELCLDDHVATELTLKPGGGVLNVAKGRTDFARRMTR